MSFFRDAPASSNNVADDLIKEGTVDSRGVFTVDVEKAHEKLERFRLADPLGYVVELVQAAGLAGAKKVAVDVSASEFVIAFDGRAFSAADLTDLESALLVKDSAAHPARQQLALGVSAARALNPRFVAVQSEKRRLTLTEKSAALVDVEEGVDDGFVTSVTVKESFQLGQFVEFFQGAFGKQKEEKMLAERCRHASFEVSVNGVIVSNVAAPCDIAVDVVDDHVRGVVGFAKGSLAPAKAVLLRAGVVQEEVLFSVEEATHLWRAPPGFVAVLDVPHLARDASFSRFVRDEAFTKALRAGLSRCRSAAALVADRVVDGHPDEAWAKEIVRAVMVHLGVEMVGSKSKVVSQLKKLAIFREANGRAVSLHELLADVDKHGHLATLPAPANTAVLEPPRAVLLLEDGVADVVNGLGVSVKDVAKDVEEAAARATRKQQWQTRKQPCELPRGMSWLGQAAARLADNEAVAVGFREHGPEPMQLLVLAGGCHLTTLTVPFPIPGLTVVVDGPLTPTRNFDDVVRDETLGRLLIEAVRLFPLVLGSVDAVWPEGRARTALMALLGAVVDGDAFVDVLFNGVGCKAPPVRWSLAAVDLTHPCCTRRLLPTLDVGNVSLKELVDGAGVIGVVPVDAVAFKPSLSPTLRAGDVLRAVLRRAAPHRALVSLNDEATQAKRRVELRTSKAPTSLTLSGVEASTPVRRGTIDGFVGWSARGARSQLAIDVHVEGRRCLRLTLPSPITGLVASLNDEKRTLTAKLEPQGPWDSLVDVVLDSVPALVTGVADPWPLALELTSTLLPTPVHTRALERLSRNLPPGEVAAAWSEILALSVGSSDGDVAAALELVVDEGSVPTVERVSAVLERRGKPPSTSADLRVRLLRPVLSAGPPLVEKLLAVFGIGALPVRRNDGATTTVAALLAAPRVRFVTTGERPLRGFDDVVLLAPTAVTLLTLLRGTALEDASPAFVAAKARAAFEEKGGAKAEVGKDVAVVAKVVVDEAGAGTGVRGEVALVDGPAADKPQADLVVLHKGKQLARVPIGRFVGVGMIAVLDCDDVTPTPTFENVVHDPKLSAVIERVRAAREVLIAQLITDVEVGNSAVDAPAGVRARLLERLAVSYTNRKHALPRSGLVGRITALPLYRTLGGDVVSLRDIEDREEDNVRYVLDDQGFDEEFADVLVVRGAAERDALAKFFSVDDVEKALAAARRLKETERRLLPLSFDIVEDGLVDHEAHIGKGTTLRLALPRVRADDANLVLRVGHKGLLVETLGSLSMLPASGVLFGDGAVTRDMKSARVDDKMLASVQREAGVLWKKALDRFDVEDDDHERALLRGWLRLGALRMAHLDVGAAAPWLVALRVQLFDARVFVLDDGGAISLATAIAEQPRSLASLLRSHRLNRDVAPGAPLVAEPTTTTTTTTTTTPPTQPATPTQKQPEPPPPPPPPLPPKETTRLQERLTTTINVVRGRGEPLTGDLELSRLIVEQGKGKAPVAIDKKRAAVVVDLAHPLAKKALDDGAALLLLTSLVVTRINERLLEVTDDDERRFHRALIGHARTFDASAT